MVSCMKEGDTMATDAQMRATRKYRAKTYDRIELQVPKGTRDRWRALAELEGKSLTAYIVSRVEGAYVHAEEIINGDTLLTTPESPSVPSDA